MKKKFFWVLLFGFFISCQTGPVDPDPIVPPVTKKYIIQVVAGQGGMANISWIEVVGGSNLDLSIIANPGYKAAYITVNNNKLLLTSSTYSLVNISSDYKVEIEFTKTQQGILCSTKWKSIKNICRYAGTTAWLPLIGEDNMTGTYKYDLNFRFEHFDINNVLTGNGGYILKEDSLIIGPNQQGNNGGRTKLQVLSNDTLKVSYVSKSIGTPKLPDREVQVTYIPTN